MKKRINYTDFTFYYRSMEELCPRGYVRHTPSCQILVQGRAAGILMAIPFVLCFTLFGVFNLVGGTVLTIMACKPKFSKKGLELLQRLIRNTDIKLQQQLDPMQLVGIILLLTGSLLVVIGISLGIIACRSVNEDKRRRRGIEEASMSGYPLSTMTERSSRRTSSISASMPSRRSDRKISLPSENIASPILEVDSEEEQEWENRKSNFNMEEQSSTDICNISPRQNSCLKSREISCKVTWATDVPHSKSETVEVFAEVAESSRSRSNDTEKVLLTTDL